MDREELSPLGIGWNHELIETVREYMDLSEIDLLDDDEVVEARGRLLEAVQRRRVRRFAESSSAFLLDFFPGAIMPREFSSFLGHLPYEAVRILLIFFSNQVQYTYWRSTNRACPFCRGNLSSSHFFLCRNTPAPYNDWASLIEEFREREYWKAVDRVFLTLQRWASICRNFAWGFGDKIMFYFQFTESQVVRRNAEVLAMQLQNVRS
jgi:hypothetical protein